MYSHTILYFDFWRFLLVEQQALPRQVAVHLQLVVLRQQRKYGEQ